MRVQPLLPFVAPALLPPLCRPLSNPPPPLLFPLLPSSCPLISPAPVSPKHISRLLIDSWFTGFQCTSEVNHPTPSLHPLSPCCPLPHLSTYLPSLKSMQHPSLFMSPSSTSVSSLVFLSHLLSSSSSSCIVPLLPFICLRSLCW